MQTMKKTLKMAFTAGMLLTLGACGNENRITTVKVEEDHGRDINLAIATNKAMQMFLDYLKAETVAEEKE